MDEQQDIPRTIQAKIRTHLANERTFLAWLRTGLATIALGLAAAQLLDDHRIAGISMSKALAGLLVAVGVWLTLLGRRRFRQTEIGIDTNTFSTRRREFDFVVIAVTVAGVVAAVLIARP